MPLETYRLQAVYNCQKLTEDGAPLPPNQAPAYHLTVPFEIQAADEQDLQRKLLPPDGKLVT